MTETNEQQNLEKAIRNAVDKAYVKAVPLDAINATLETLTAKSASVGSPKWVKMRERFANPLGRADSLLNDIADVMESAHAHGMGDEIGNTLAKVALHLNSSSSEQWLSRISKKAANTIAQRETGRH